MRSREKIVILEKNVSSPFLLVYGVISAFTVVLQQNILFLTAEYTAFTVIVLLEQQRYSFYSALLFLLVTVFFNALSPEGKVLWEPLGLPITEDAIIRGTRRAITLLTLFVMSKALLGNVLLPARVRSGLVGKILAALQYMTTRKKSIRTATLLTDVDRVLCETDSSIAGHEAFADRAPQSRFGFLFYYLILASHTIFLILQ
ncbi:MAG TPA: hypothetical protein ENN69_03550 [Spirochaetia bacterium]|nr:hypothetical protein [Spirochaetia bacterium]